MLKLLVRIIFVGMALFCFGAALRELILDFNRKEKDSKFRIAFDIFFVLVGIFYAVIGAIYG